MKFKPDKSICPVCGIGHPIYDSECKEKRNLKQRLYRISVGITKEINTRKKVNGVWRSKTKEYKRLSAKADRIKRRKYGRPSMKTIQLVYEDNIKKYGTLTCYLCLKEIILGKEHLEHKTPLSREGSNLYDNLEVSCAKCNTSKGKKTLDEYLIWKRRKLNE